MSGRLQLALLGVLLTAAALATVFASGDDEQPSATRPAGTPRVTATPHATAPPRPELPRAGTNEAPATLTESCRAAYSLARAFANSSVDQAIRTCGSLDEYLSAAAANPVVVNRFLSTTELVQGRCRLGPVELERTAVCRDAAVR